MASLNRPVQTACLTGLALLLALSGCTSPLLSDGSETRTTGYYAWGLRDSARFSLGFAYNGTEARTPPSCAYLYANDETNRGQFKMAAVMSKETVLEVNFEEFGGDAILQDGGLAANRSERGGFGIQEDSFPYVKSRMSGWGNASVSVNLMPYSDPISGPSPPDDPRDGVDFDIADANWSAHFIVLEDGIRDDETNAILSAEGAGPFDPRATNRSRVFEGDVEAHLLLSTKPAEPGQQGPSDEAYFYENPDETGTGYIRANRHYEQEHLVPNTALGAQATFSIQVESQAPTLSQTEFYFNLTSPEGRDLGSHRLGGGATPTESKAFTVPMDELESYHILVQGRAVLARYSILVTFEAPESIVLAFWWEDVRFGEEVIGSAQACLDEIMLQDAPLQAGTGVAKSRPPGFNVELVAVSVAAAIVMGLLFVKFVLDSVKGAEFAKKFRKR